MEDKIYETDNLYLASVLSMLLKTEPRFKLVAERILFCFPMSEELQAAIDDYVAGVPVDAFALIQMIKRLRNEMYTRRNLGRNLEGRSQG